MKIFIQIPKSLFSNELPSPPTPEYQILDFEDTTPSAENNFSTGTLRVQFAQFQSKISLTS